MREKRNASPVCRSAGNSGVKGKIRKRTILLIGLNKKTGPAKSPALVRLSAEVVRRGEGRRAIPPCLQGRKDRSEREGGNGRRERRN